MMLLSVCILLAAVAAPGVRCQKESCNEDMLLKCMSLQQTPNFNYGTMKEELDSVCPDLLASITCVDNYSKNCFEPEKRSVFNKLYSEMSMTAQDICQEGPYQSEFMKHAHCMTVMKKKGDCSKDYSEALSAPTENVKTKVCCSLRKFLRCLTDVVYEHCGEETGKFTAGYLDRITNALQVMVCQGFSADGAECNENNGTGRSRLSGLLLLSAAVLLRGFGH